MKKLCHIDLEATSGQIDHVTAIPATYVIDTVGTIVFFATHEDSPSARQLRRLCVEVEKIGMSR